VQVSFEPRAGVGPALGDAVTFSTEIDGIRVDAGHGEVAEAEAGSVWVRVSRGRPGLGHTAVIRATGRGEQPRVQPAPPPTSREAARGPEYIDLPATLGALPLVSSPVPPGAVARDGRRLMRPARGWPEFAGTSVRFAWRTEDGPLDPASHFRLSRHVAEYGADHFNKMFVGILWYPPGSGRGLCTPRVNRDSNTGSIGLIGPRGDVRVMFNPSAFTFASKAVPDLSVLMAFAAEIFAQLEPFANPCRP
jgi:hypothetical protein